VIACVEYQKTINQSPDHLRQKEHELPTQPLLVPATRPPPGKLPLFNDKKSSSTAFNLKKSQWQPCGMSGRAPSIRIKQIGMISVPDTVNTVGGLMHAIFPVQPAGSVRKSTFERPFIFPTLKVAAYLLVVGRFHCLGYAS